MELVICRQCGQPVPLYYVSQGLCDGCKWDTWIPERYEKKERYLYDPGADHLNRTVRPPLGVPFLDMGLRQVDLSAFAMVAETDVKRFALKLLTEGFTQQETAQRVGVCTATICNWAAKAKKKFLRIKNPGHFRVKH